jgi:hypothetical protein
MNIPELHVGRAAAFGPVTVFPVWAGTKQVRGVRTGAHAEVRVGELPDGAQVPVLTVTNLGPTSALLLEGELLEGGMQTRTLAYDVLLAAKDSAIVEVACVEQGRWHGGSGHARRARKVTPSVTSRLRENPSTRQSAVWDGVAQFESALGATPSQSFADHLDRAADRPPSQVPILPGQTGVIVGVAGWPTCLELFGSRESLAADLPGILGAAELDAALSPSAAPVPSRRARRFADLVSGLALQARPAEVGYGTRLSVTHADLSARGIAVPNGSIAHLGAINLRHQLIGVAG